MAPLEKFLNVVANPPCSRYSVVTRYISSPVVLSGIDLQNKKAFSIAFAIYESNIYEELTNATRPLPLQGHILWGL